MERYQEKAPRREIAFVSILGTTQLHLRSPYVVAWWSAAFPGLGHLLLSKYIRGFFLFTWEIVINYNAHINTAVLYTFTGRFNMAREVLDIRWLLLYCSLYVFAIWDSYRTTIDINNQFLLAQCEEHKIEIFKLSALEFNYLDKRTPWISAIWSLLMPGAGQLYIHRIITAAFTLVWWIIILYYSNALPAIQYTFTGDFEQARKVLDPHWALNIASVYLFAMYDAFINTVENNKLFDYEQSLYLKREYQDPEFKIPNTKNNMRGEKMHIFATIEHTIYLEKAIANIQSKGISKESIFAISMEKKDEKRKIFDSIHQSDGLSIIDLAAVLGTILMLLGTIYGFVLAWGPIFWGLAGLVGGFAIGLVIKLIMTSKYAHEHRKDKKSEVVLIIECTEDASEMVKEILWENHALGVSGLSEKNHE